MLCFPLCGRLSSHKEGNTDVEFGVSKIAMKAECVAGPRCVLMPKEGEGEKEDFLKS